jgi:hypothetical protein
MPPSCQKQGGGIRIANILMQWFKKIFRKITAIALICNAFVTPPMLYCAYSKVK